MNCYEFTLTFALPDAKGDPEFYLDALFDAGCGDALAGVGQPGCIALEFTREAKFAAAAVDSALADVRAAIPGAELIEAKPDLVGLSDVAEVLQCSRQNIRKYLINYPDFPKPVYSGAASLWHLWEVAGFTKIHIPETLAEISMTTFKLNMDIQQRRFQQAMTKVNQGL